ncbi:ZIP zinc/iron transport family [Annulohypoxylon maeteangense]|uniref:ZIP zinc/iron transport family n=1 Tax=Annulohypoxylon maeteangense TaxID=1927788 RepID=UPI002008A141|nr:ZIP zinc/iron transport family [Annulohypoxylon maeteangense]KAI0887553.1 ZIP zinc/iron transport family [Annulohypoxylon maeteangense]
MSILHEVVGAALKTRQDDSSAPESGFQVTVDCDAGNDYDGRMGLRISSIFVILVGSLIGAVLPVYLGRSSRMRVNGKAFFIAKYFGSGVIIGTAFMHLLSPAFDALKSPCLTGPITSYDWAAGICLMTVFVMFTVELLASRFDFFGHSHGDHGDDAKAIDPSVDALRNGAQGTPMTDRDVEAGSAIKESASVAGTNGLPTDLSYPPGGEDHLGHQREHHGNDNHAAFAAQMTSIFILEFGVVFHSVFIGLTLAVAGEEFTVLYIVLVFHQTFEGLGLGSRLASAQWPRSKWLMPYFLGLGYALSTPISIAIGLGVRATLQPGSPKTLIINGVFDSISAGILIYTGLVELLAHEFMFNEYMRNAGLKVQLAALLCVALGCGLMAVLAEWA